MVGGANRQKLCGSYQLLQQQYATKYPSLKRYSQSTGRGCSGTFGIYKVITQASFQTDHPQHFHIKKPLQTN